LELDAALGPFLELRGDVFRDEHNLRGAPDEFVLLGVGLGNDQRKDSRAIRRRYSDPALTGLDPGIERDVEAELVNEKAQAAILVTDKDVDTVKAQVGRFTLR
jgi:hypothetical protein